jgi:RNA polymerase sigma factor (sigma-70 family)
VDLLACLSDRDRLICLLRFKEDMSLGEIGQLLGVGESRISQCMTYVLNRLRNQSTTRYGLA